jgi:hypothetical protein
MSAIARSALKRFVRATGTAGSGPVAAASGALSFPIRGKPWTATTTRAAPSAS